MNTLEHGLRPVIDRLKRFSEGFDEKRIKNVRELVDIFSKDKTFANRVLGKNLSLWNEYQRKSYLSGEKKTSDLLRIRNFYNTPNYERSEEKLKSLLDFDPEKEPEYHTFSRSPSDPELAEKELSTELKKHFQNILIAYSIISNKNLYIEEGGLNYDAKKEQRQIEAIVSGLEGDHVHMATGEGKSTVVVSIMSIVESVTSEQKDCIVSTANSTLLKKIKQKTDKLLKKISTDTDDIDIKGAFDFELSLTREKQSGDSLDEELFNQMQRESLLTQDGSYLPDTLLKIRQQFWESKLKDGHGKKDLLEKEFNNPRINYLTERQLVFEFSDDPAGFSKKAPRIFMDEADISYHRKSPYVEDVGDNLLSKDDIRESAYNWLFYYVVSHQIKNKDFKFEDGVYKFKAGLENSRRFFLDDKLLRRGIKIIAQKLKIEEKDVSLVLKNAKKFVKQDFSDKNMLRDVVRHSADIIGSMLKEEGKQFFFEDSGKLKIRDSYIDELLEHHEYQPDYHLAVLAINDRFDFIQMNKAVSSITKFPVFISYLKDKLVCLSGTLKYPDPKTKKIKETNFSRFLMSVTGKKVKTIVNPQDIKTVPLPILFEKEEQAITKLIENVVPNQPTLIIDYQGTIHARKLFERLSNFRSEGRDKIVLLPPKPTEIEQEEEYNILLDQMSLKLSEGEIDMIISSGAAATGVNFVRRNGTFPDLKVVLFGMPKNEIQPTQGVSRRRAEGDGEAIWFLSLDQTEKSVSAFQEEKSSKLDISLGKLDQTKIKEMLKEALAHPEKSLDVALELLRQKQNLEKDDENMTIAYDIFYREFKKIFGKKLYEKIRESFPDIGMRKKAFAFMGMPETLYFEIPTRVDSVGTNDQRDYTNKLARSVFFPKPGEGNDIFLNQWVKSWFDINIEKTKVFLDLIYFGGKVDKRTHFIRRHIHQVSAPHHFETSPIAIFPPINGYNPVDINGKLGVEKDGQVFYITDGLGIFTKLTDLDYNQLSILPVSKNDVIVFIRK